MQHILSMRERAEMRKVADRPTQTTGVIRSIRLVNTGPLSAVVCPPTHKVIHIGSVLPSLVDLTDISKERVLQGFRLAFLYQRIELADAVYVVKHVYPDPGQVGRILARLEREDA
jgi:hypothetical protein